MPYRVKRVPATTNNVTTAIVNRLNADGHCARRINNAAVYDRKAGAYRQTRKDQRGIADILACLRGGAFLAIEIKTGKDRQSPEQKAYQAQVEDCEGWYLVVKTYADFELWYSCSNFKP